MALKAHLGSGGDQLGPTTSRPCVTCSTASGETGQSWWGVKEGAIDFVGRRRRAGGRQEEARRSEGRPQGGTFHPWTGPIVGRDGRVRVARTPNADDKFLGGIKFYVRGVEGKVPGDGK